jgi:hypothetical protein
MRTPELARHSENNVASHFDRLILNAYEKFWPR